MPKILVIQQKMIGDVLTCTVVCEALRKKFPNATIDYLINSSTIPVVQGNPFFDNIVEFKNEYRQSKYAFYRFLKKIRNSKYDLVIDAYGKLESNLIVLFSGATEKISFYKKYTNFLYTKTINRISHPITNASTTIENRLLLVYPKNKICENIIQPKIFLSELEKEESKTFLKSNGITFDKPLIMISVLGSEIRKTLPYKYMAKLIDEIVSTTNADILFNYIPSQEKEAKAIYELTLQKTQLHTHLNVYGKNLREFISILSHCNALIGNEGGATNIAKALNKPTFTIFSPWIVKGDWNMFEDGFTHDSVHLADFKPNLYKDKPIKEIKKNALKLYQEFDSSLILPKLQNYLKKHNFKSYSNHKE